MTTLRIMLEELSNSARIDGCSEHLIFRRIIMPLTKPTLATALLFGQFETNFGMVFAVLSMASIPVMVFYLFLSRYFIKGLTKGAMKG